MGYSKKQKTMDRRQEYLDLVDDLNEELYNKFGDDLNTYYYYTSYGFVDEIGFGKVSLWDSENDDRNFLEDKNDYEPLKPFIKKQLTESGKVLMKYSRTK